MNNETNACCALAQVTSSRYEMMCVWLHEQLGQDISVTPMVQDASNRAYYRILFGDQSRVVMDAPPEKESVVAFVAIAEALLSCGLNVPVIYAKDTVQGFLLLSDMGDDLYFKLLSSETADELYAHAFDAIIQLQRCESIPGYEVPQFTKSKLIQELDLFDRWYLHEYLKVDLTASQRAALSGMYELLVDQALVQPQVLIHKDFHSRNLFALGGGQVGVIDFQDALIGPITYDLMSLLYDHYLVWPRDKIVEWVGVFYRKLMSSGFLEKVDFIQFLRWHDWLVLQRVLKNCGNFVRLDVLHNKPGYLQDIPRIYNFILFISNEYPELAELADLLRLWKPQGVSL